MTTTAIPEHFVLIIAFSSINNTWNFGLSFLSISTVPIHGSFLKTSAFCSSCLLVHPAYLLFSGSCFERKSIPLPAVWTTWLGLEESITHLLLEALVLVSFSFLA